MARIATAGRYTKLWLSAADTYDWAHRPGLAWPGSDLSGKRVFAEFDNRSGDLVDLMVNGRRWDGDGNEFTAMTDDFLREKLPAGHGARRGADYRAEGSGRRRHPKSRAGSSRVKVHVPAHMRSKPKR